VLYAKDAMEGLSLANSLRDEEKMGEMIEERRQKESAVAVLEKPATAVKTEIVVPKRSNISTDAPVYIPNDLKKHVIKNYSLAMVEPYINLQMLLGHHLGVKGKISRLLAEKDEKVVGMKEMIDDLMTLSKQENLIKPSATYQFFPAQADGDDVVIYDSDEKTEIERFTFPRQQKEPFLCLADYLKPKESGIMDYVCMFAVTAGKGVRELSKNFKDNGDFLKSHALQALALETAEGLAERMHQQIRDQWGFPDSPDFTMQERFTAKYQGQRFSFGYPACPNLEDQEKLFKLLQPEEIGIQLTDGFMMEPEASVTALVFSHPQARYFNVL
jgi:5-methyltetrahydrofolate--homocysteine methyltransferase